MELLSNGIRSDLVKLIEKHKTGEVVKDIHGILHKHSALLNFLDSEIVVYNKRVMREAKLKKINKLAILIHTIFKKLHKRTSIKKHVFDSVSGNSSYPLIFAKILFDERILFISLLEKGQKKALVDFIYRRFMYNNFTGFCAGVLKTDPSKADAKCFVEEALKRKNVMLERLS